MITVIITVVTFLILATCFCFATIAVCLLAWFAFSKLRGGINFMSRKDWKRVRNNLNYWHEETAVAAASQNLRELLADDE